MRIFQIDSFSAVPFRGNPAAVCLLDGRRDAAWMQSVAAEMNVSETAFVARRADGAYDLRWFSPCVEVDLCGHATLASAHALWEAGEEPAGSRIGFHTRSGLLEAWGEPQDGRVAVIRMDFPAEPAEALDPVPDRLAAALHADTPRWVGRSRFDYVVEVGGPDAVRDMRPDFRSLAEFPVRAIVVTSVGDGSDGADFVSRVFAPSTGIDEDPVTGSAHCCLGPYWGPRLGKTRMVGYQASSRGGFVGVELAGNRVVLDGQAVTVLRGELV